MPKPSSLGVQKGGGEKDRGGVGGGGTGWGGMEWVWDGARSSGGRDIEEDVRGAERKPGFQGWNAVQQGLRGEIFVRLRGLTPSTRPTLTFRLAEVVCRRTEASAVWSCEHPSE